MNTHFKQIAAVLLFLLSHFVSVQAQVKLPRLVSNGMVLQRNAEIKIWGSASAGETIGIQFIGANYQTKADASGHWEVKLKNLKAGGPYTMQIKASNEITLSDILVGDVWLCSGQSNMEFSVENASLRYPKEIANSTNPNIRQFLVPQAYDFNVARSDYAWGEWKSADPKNVLQFSAVAYFFARELYAKYKIPIGLINASLGGSPAESWMSAEALKAFPEHLKEAIRFQDSTLIQQIEREDNARSDAWYKALFAKDLGYKNPSQTWFSPSLDASDWLSMKVPGYWADTQLGAVNGVLWFRKQFSVPAAMAGQAADLNLGRIVDADSVYINGVFVGTTTYLYPRRWYKIPAGVLKAENNTIVIRVVNNSGRGGFVLDKEYEIVSGKTVVDLRGDWQYKLAATSDPLAGPTFVRWKPEGLYNAMISPLLPYRVKGVIWYQGESNAGRPAEYATLFPALIADWRNKMAQAEMPFLFVQLTNYMDKQDQPSESSWAQTRESQQKTLAVPNTGMAVTIDIGEWNDIHPLNKQDVGRRLALAAYKVAYHEKNTVLSPNFESMQIKGNKATLKFTNTGKGLVSKGSADLHYFAIAGADKKFVWAKAKIVNNQVVVWSDAVTNPVAVRYAWADAPDGANLYNKEGLPASPFRTDSW
ncbi:MAG: hypothetical protein RIS47_1322 [Bacteroidota bacterium]